MPLSSVLGAQSLVRPGVCTSSTRPASPFEGQTIYETDTDRLATWDGSAWIPYVRQTAGKVLQVVSTTKTDTFTASVANASSTDITGLSASITPSSTSSKILAVASVTGSGTGTNGTLSGLTLKLVRGSTDIFIGDAASNRTRISSANFSVPGAWQGNSAGNTTIAHLDSPSSTNSTTYKLQLVGAIGNNQSTTFYVNYSATDTDNNSFWRSASSITLMEISG